MSERPRRSLGEIQQSVARDILTGIEALMLEAQEAVRPLEVEPYRSRLFSFFATADGAGLITTVAEAEPRSEADEKPEDERNLSADNLCRLLARRWGLDMAARESVALQTRLPADQLDRMRLLWSVMRMWMEWTYAWQHWAEFHELDSE